MARFERLLIPIVLLIVIGAFLLEGAGPSGARIVALSIGVLLVLAIVVGMYHRVKKKGRTPPGGETEEIRDQTSNSSGSHGGGSV